MLFLRARETRPPCPVWLPTLGGKGGQQETMPYQQPTMVVDCKVCENENTSAWRAREPGRAAAHRVIDGCHGEGV
jgi:hypothetical protein